MKVTKVSDDESDKINVELSYTYGIDDDEITETVEMSITLGKNDKGNLVLHFERLAGQQLYFKKIVGEIKSKFAYAIQH